MMGETISHYHQETKRKTAEVRRRREKYLRRGTACPVKSGACRALKKFAHYHQYLAENRG